MSLPRRNLLGTRVTLCDYESAAAAILAAARERRAFGVAAQPVHGITTAWLDPEYRAVLNDLELVTPDGQPVRWALNRLHGAGLRDRVYGPFLTLEVCAGAAREDLPVFLYGTTDAVLAKLSKALEERFPGLRIAGTLSPPFRALTADEEAAHVETIRGSGARITLVGLGCPRQERWAHRHRAALGMPVLAVGAAFDFISGQKPWAPAWMQRAGLEWLFRLASEPRRLAARYLLLNPLYVALVSLQALGVTFANTTPRIGPPSKLVAPGARAPG